MPTGNKDSKNDDLGGDYDFSAMKFGDDDDARGADASSGDDIFGAFGGADSGDDFGDDGNQYDFEKMPDPSQPKATFGDIDAEFADISDNRSKPASSTMADFEEEKDFAPAASESSDEDDDPYENDEGSGDDYDVDREGADSEIEDDEFADDEVEENAASPSRGAKKRSASADRPGIGKFAVPLAAVLGVCVMGYGAYSYVSPMIFGGPEPIQSASPPVQPQASSFPTSLPGKQTPPMQPLSQPLPPSTTQQSSMPPPAPAPIQSAQVAQPAAMPPPPQIFQSAQGSGLPPPQAPHMAQPVFPPQGGLPGGIVLPEMRRDASSPESSVGSDNELVGGSNRGGIAAMKEALPRPDAMSPSIEEKFGSLQVQIDALRNQILVLADALNGRGAVSSSAPQPMPAQPLSYPPPQPMPPQPTGVVVHPAPMPSAGSGQEFQQAVQPIPVGLLPPLKPVIVEGVSLKGVSRDVAWVSTASGVVEVKEGGMIPNAGEVIKIKSYGGDWIVVTTQGIIVR